MREISQAAFEKQNERAILALKIYSYRIIKYIGAYTAVMNGLDMLVFTGGIGENAAFVRQEVCQHLDYLGISIDENLNEETHGIEQDISDSKARVKIMVIPTNEELIIAEDTLKLIS
jgi:acetate kinase